MRRFVVSALALAAACSAGGTGPGGLTRGWKLGPTQAGYTVASADHPGTALIRGTWDFRIAADSTITGTWSAFWVSTDTLAQVGPQVGSGTLSGRLLNDGSLSVGLNPDLVDNNVWVVVKPFAGSDGTWTWSTIAGPWAHGPFHFDPPIF